MIHDKNQPLPPAVPTAAPELDAGAVRELVDALQLIADPKWWRRLNGELVWRGESPDGNEILNQDPFDIATPVLAKFQRGG